MNILFEYIKKTDNDIIDIDDEVLIKEYIKNTIINKDNISLILKLISNLISKNITIDFDINNIYKYDLSDGDIICLIKIYSSTIFDNIDIAIQLTNDFNVHKTSSYVPLFDYLILTNNHNLIKKLYMQYIKQNIMIIRHNQEIKEHNYNTRLYNNNLKLLKQKYAEFNTIISTIKNININDNPFTTYKFSIPDMTEFKYKTEQNLISIDSPIISNIIRIAINNSDTQFIHNILSEHNMIKQPLIDLLLTYFINHKCTTLDINNRCMCCKNIITYNIINDAYKRNILDLIKDKIINITHRTDNGMIIDKKDLNNIRSKFNELTNLLLEYDFNLIIDGANLGYLNSSKNEININFMRSIINQLLNKTNKYILLIIHNRHQSVVKQLKINNKYLHIYFTPSNLDDDLFWLYSSIYSNAYILTNDQSRNNSCMISYQHEIKRWLEYYQIKLDINYNVPNIINKYQIANNVCVCNDDNIHIKLSDDQIICINK
jgi:hypothetical protein